ncbi:MAG: AsmA family protein [Acidobacteria bacterium]|nr:AsmA family protein [Acidobacteriota bacterium]
MKRLLKWAAVLVAAALAVAPFLNADRFAPRIRAGLEQSLGRKVDIGYVRVHLLTGPGFTLRNVVIHEDAKVSAEPFAYVGTMVVKLRVLSLLQGKLEFSSLRLEKVHVNLMRARDGSWNVQGMFQASRDSHAPLAELEVRGGRLNFKFEDTKSVYYFTNADIDFSASDAETFDIWFVGEPSRTDTLARGFGRVTARGRLRDIGAEPALELDVRLDRSALQEIAMLIGGADLGVHGSLQSRARVAGPVSKLKIEGTLQLADLHHWSQPPRGGTLPVSYTGELRLPEQSLRLETDAKQPLQAELRLDKYLSTAQWVVGVEAKKLPIAGASEWLRPPGAAFNGMKLEGTIDGSFHVGHDVAATGEARVTALKWTWGDGNTLESEEVAVTWKDRMTELRAAQAELDGQPLAAECARNGAESSWDCKATSRAIDVRKLRNWTQALGVKASWFDSLGAGQLRGTVQVKQSGGDPLEWSGNVEIRNGEVAVPELDAPVKVAAASATWGEGKLQVQNAKLTAAGAAWSGSYRFDGDGVRPHRVVLEADAVEYDTMEKALRPMAKPSSGFLSRALGLGGTQAPAGSGGVDFELRAKKAGVLENVRLAGSRESERVSISAWSATWQESKWSGKGVLRWTAATPELDITGGVRGLAWSGGVVESDWRLTGRPGAELHIDGTANGAGMVIGEPVESLQGRYRVTIGRRGATAAFDRLEGAKLTGKPVERSAGPFVLVFEGEGREVRLRVSLQPFEIGNAIANRAP